MRTWAKFIVSVLVAALAVASAVQVAQATKMDTQTSMLMETEGGCSYCPKGSDGDGIPCPSGCVVSSAALPAQYIVGACPALGLALEPVRKAGLSGWRAPPDPYPPKYLF